MNRRKRENFILQAAIRVFARMGYNKATVFDIIDEAQVARGTFYLYFKNKKELFESLLDMFMTQMMEDVARIHAFNHPEELDLSKKFRLLTSDLISTIVQHRQLAKIILVDAHGLEDEFEGKIRLFEEQIIALIRHNLDQAIASGVFRPMATEVVARCMVGSVKEMLIHWLTREEIEIESTIEGMIDYLLGGLLPIATVEKQVPAENFGYLQSEAKNYH